MKTKTSTAFTLVELLVAIGIIGLLISLLMPVFALARGKAQNANCLNNLRQISQGAHAYAASNRGRIPVNTILVNEPAGSVKESFFPPPFFISLLQHMTQNHDPQEPALWHSAIEKKFKVAQTFRCPSDTSSLTAGGTEGALARYIVSLTANEYVWQNSEWYIGASYCLNGGLVNSTHDPRFQHRWYGGNVSRAKKSSSMVLAGDSLIHASMHMYWTPELNSPETTMTLADVYRGTANVAEDFRVGNPFDTKRHRGKINLVFVDGHAETVPIGKELARCDLLQGK